MLHEIKYKIRKSLTIKVAGGWENKKKNPGEDPGEARVEVPPRSPAEAHGEEVVIWKACPRPEAASTSPVKTGGEADFKMIWTLYLYKTGLSWV